MSKDNKKNFMHEFGEERVSILIIHSICNKGYKLHSIFSSQEKMILTPLPSKFSGFKQTFDIQFYIVVLENLISFEIPLR